MIPRRLVLATENVGKARELADLVRDWGGIEVTSLAAFDGVGCPPENGASYRENAVLKARVVAAATGLPALADDSGLEVDALDGAPGLHSARWAGADANDADRVQKLLTSLAGVPEERRTARFRCVVALAWPDGRIETAEGSCPGRIAVASTGSGGFGYDPVFVSDELGRTFAVATAVEKQRVGHRGRAVVALARALRRV